VALQIPLSRLLEARFAASTGVHSATPFGVPAATAAAASASRGPLLPSPSEAQDLLERLHAFEAAARGGDAARAAALAAGKGADGSADDGAGGAIPTAGSATQSDSGVKGDALLRYILSTQQAGRGSPIPCEAS
jgi:hypothetical protein